jgi:hypothetical protein
MRGGPTWILVFNGIADRWLWGFEADGWRLAYSDPAYGALRILPSGQGPAATMEDALWLADALAFDHDAPVGIAPSALYADPTGRLCPTELTPPDQPIHPFDGEWSRWYWYSINQALVAAADLRFNGSYVIRYEPDAESPRTDFSMRFHGREGLVSMYAMAARQPDRLSEYLCLYRILEAADKQNGKCFAASEIDNVMRRDFGVLRVVGDDLSFEAAPNVFEIYRQRAQAELLRLEASGVTDVAQHLYGVRNSLAHGKHGVLTSSHTVRFQEAARALPIVKLLARAAVEP